MSLFDIAQSFLRPRKSSDAAPPQDAYSNVRWLSAHSYAKRIKDQREKVLCITFKSRVEAMKRV